MLCCACVGNFTKIETQTQCGIHEFACLTCLVLIICLQACDQRTSLNASNTKYVCSKIDEVLLVISMITSGFFGFCIIFALEFPDLEECLGQVYIYCIVVNK